MPINFEELFTTLKDKIAILAKVSFSSLGAEAKADGERLLQESKENLLRWTELLATDQITAEDFELLVLSQKDLVEMEALRQAGLAKIKAQQFRDGVVNIIVDTVTHVVGI